MGGWKFQEQFLEYFFKTHLQIPQILILESVFNSDLISRRTMRFRPTTVLGKLGTVYMTPCCHLVAEILLILALRTF